MQCFDEPTGIPVMLAGKVHVIRTLGYYILLSGLKEPTYNLLAQTSLIPHSSTGHLFFVHIYHGKNRK